MGNPSQRHPRFLFRDQLDALLTREPRIPVPPETVPGSREKRDEETTPPVPVPAGEEVET